MTQKDVLTIQTLGDELDEITKQLILKFNQDIEAGNKPDLKLVQAIRDTYKDKVDMLKFTLNYDLKKQEVDNKLPESAKRKKLENVEVK